MPKKQPVRRQENLDEEQSKGRSGPDPVSVSPDANPKPPVRIPNLPLITFEGIEGYCASDVAIWMDKKGIVDGWRKFIYGSTGAYVSIEGRNIMIVYRWDVENFLNGLPNTD